MECYSPCKHSEIPPNNRLCNHRGTLGAVVARHQPWAGLLSRNKQLPCECRLRTQDTEPPQCSHVHRCRSRWNCRLGCQSETCSCRAECRVQGGGHSKPGPWGCCQHGRMECLVSEIPPSLLAKPGVHNVDVCPLFNANRGLSPGEFSNDCATMRNRAQNEKTFITILGNLLNATGTPNHAIMDTSRSGIHGLRMSWSSWCNVNGAGFGKRPTADQKEIGLPLADAFVWATGGGVSDGTSDETSPNFDPVCGLMEAFKPSPDKGEWNQAYFEMLLREAKPEIGRNRVRWHHSRSSCSI